METPEDLPPDAEPGEAPGEAAPPEGEATPAEPTLEEFRRMALSQALQAELGNAEAVLPLLFRAARRDARRLFRALSEAARDAAADAGTSPKKVKLLEKTASRLAAFRRNDPPTLRDLVELLEKLEKAEARMKSRAARPKRRG